MKKALLAIITFILSLLIIEMLLRAAGMVLSWKQNRLNINSIEQKGNYRILCLGESTTAEGGIYSYPRQLEDILNNAGTGIRFSVINRGVPSTDSANILAMLKKNLNTYKPDLVITMMGVNDESWSDVLRYDDTLYTKFKLLIKNLRLLKLLRYINGEMNNEQTAGLHSGIKVPHIDQILLEEGWNSLNSGKLKETINLYKDALKKDPGDPVIYRDLSAFYIKNGEYNAAEKMLKNAVKIYPDSHILYLELGTCYIKQEKYDAAELEFKRSMSIQIDNEAFYGLAKCYVKQERFEEAEASYLNALKINPEDDEPYFVLGWHYVRRSELKKAKKLLEEYVKRNPGHSFLKRAKFYGGIAVTYQQSGIPKLAKQCFKNATNLRLTGFNPDTRSNYTKLVDIVLNKGINLICVQYPMRNLKSLKKLIRNRKGIIFVDNEKIFKKAVKDTNYLEYFTDMFGGEFGHCTPKGNKLLASNIANTILKKICKTKR